MHSNTTSPRASRVIFVPGKNKMKRLCLWRRNIDLFKRRNKSYIKTWICKRDRKNAWSFNIVHTNEIDQQRFYSIIFLFIAMISIYSFCKTIKQLFFLFVIDTIQKCFPVTFPWSICCAKLVDDIIKNNKADSIMFFIM